MSNSDGLSCLLISRVSIVLKNLLRPLVNVASFKFFFALLNVASAFTLSSPISDSYLVYTGEVITYAHSRHQDLALVTINLDFPTAMALKPLSTSSVSTVGENRLACNPSTIRAEEADDRSNVLDHGKTTPHAIRFMELNGFRRFLGIEERYL